MLHALPTCRSKASLSIKVSHDYAKEPMPWYGEESSEQGGREALLKYIQDVLYCGEAKPDKDRIDNPINGLIQLGAMPCRACQEEKLPAFFA